MSTKNRLYTAHYGMPQWLRRQMRVGGTVIQVVLRRVCISVVQEDLGWADAVFVAALFIAAMFLIAGCRG